MEQTFMTIHNLSLEANILFASDSIIDILGYQPQDVLDRSCFDYFHPEEVPFARNIHSRGVRLDKAAVLHYVRIRARDGRWVSCECCFTVVHDVLVACTSIYRRGARSERRAIEAPQISRIFSSSPRDPRYHMLEHLSPKFKMAPVEREPRAALILNRFTRPLSIMFATNAVSQILGVTPDQLNNKSFYECIAPNCLADAVRCLESAKANDSIAYLRFWYRDPRREEDFVAEQDGELDVDMHQDSLDSDSSDGGVPLHSAMDIDSEEMTDHDVKAEIKSEPVTPNLSRLELQPAAQAESSSSGSNGVSHPQPPPYQADSPEPLANSQQRAESPRHRARQREPMPSFELEAVVSCTSDGLVVVLRRARPPVPTLHPPLLARTYENGLFAAPWGEQPIDPYFSPEQYYHFRPPLLPQHMPLQDHVEAAGGPPIDQLMRSIRDVAVFAWALVGINGKLAAYAHGSPQGDAQPADGLPIWDPTAGATSYLGPAYKGKGAAPSEPPPYGSIYTNSTSYGHDVAPDRMDTNYPYSPSSLWTYSRTYTHISGAQANVGRPSHQSPRGPLNSHDHNSQEAWAPYYGQQHNGNSVPTTQGSSTDEDPPRYQHAWQ
ncbi:hypothetical protein BX600DRAFT_505184 [Xylariales sp. PMI_506]|nr:hypothetical protein BX600DRAFT_505184 [Xylariales sp. PMI_506]